MIDVRDIDRSVLSSYSIGRELDKVQIGTLLNYQNYIKKIFSSSIIAYYPHDEEAGVSVIDISGNQNNGVYYGALLGNEGMYGSEKAIEQDDKTDSVNITSSGLSDVLGRAEGTFSTWVKIDSSIWEEVSTQVLFRLYINATNYVRIDAVNNSITCFYQSSNGLINFNIPYQARTTFLNITLSWSVLSDEINFYINSVNHWNVASGVAALSGVINSANIGNYNHVVDSGLRALYSNSIIFNKALSQAEVKSIYRVKDGFIMSEGDSRTSSFLVPHKTLNLLTDRYLMDYNNALAGGTIAQMTARGGDTDSYIQSGVKNIIVVFAGVNDFTKTSQQLYDELSAYCLARKLSGYKVIICTEIDSTEAARVAAGWNATYQGLNILIRNNNSFADAVADLGADARLQNGDDTTYFLDKIHPTSEGAEVIGSIIAPVINNLL